jgi:hypothetical protein
MDVSVIGIAIICKISNRKRASTADIAMANAYNTITNQYEDTVNIQHVIATCICMSCVVYT